MAKVRQHKATPGATPHRVPWRAEIIAGISVAVVGIPQSIAYAELAGLPPDRGLITVGVGAVVGAAFGSSPVLQTGPAALASLFTLGILTGRAEVASVRFVALAGLLAVEVGLVRLALSRLRLGRLSYILSTPVIVGLSTGAGVTIILSQFPALFGVTAESNNPAIALGGILTHLGAVRAAAIITGAAVLVAAVFLPLIDRRIPATLIALAVGIAVASFTGGVESTVLSQAPLGLDWTALAVADAIALAGPAAILAVVGFSEAAAISRRYATVDRYRWDADRELLGQGAASIAGGLVGGFPVSGSFARTALARASGGRTRVTAIVSGVVALAVVPLAPYLPGIPKPALAAIVVAAGVSLIDVRGLRRLFTNARLQFLVAVGTLLAMLVFAPRVDLAVMTGIALATGAHLFREEQLHVYTSRDGPVLRLSVEGVVFFASTPRLVEEVSTAVAADAQITGVIVDLSGAGRVDVSGALALDDALRDLVESGLDVSIVNVPGHADKILRRMLGDRYGVASQ